MTEKKRFSFSPLRILEWTEEGLSFLGLSFVFILMAVVSVNVIMRYVFNMPIKGAVESSGLMMVIIVFLPLAYAQRHGGHIRVDVLISHLPFRYRNALEILSHTVALGVCALILWRALITSWVSVEIGEITTGVSDVTCIPSRFSVAIGALFLCLCLLSQIIRFWRAQFQSK